jgi:hypothetical protein
MKGKRSKNLLCSYFGHLLIFKDFASLHHNIRPFPITTNVGVVKDSAQSAFKHQYAAQKPIFFGQIGDN